MLTGLIALAVSLGVLALIVIASLLGPRDPGGRLPGNGGAILPGHGHWDEGGGGGDDA